MAIVRVQAPVGGTAAANTAIHVGLTATGVGESIIALTFSNSTTAPSLTDSKTNTYTQNASLVSTESVYIHSCLAPTSGVTSVTWNALTGKIFIAFVGTYTGLLSASAFDKTSGNVNALSTTYTSNATATLAQASELCVGIAGTGQSAVSNVAASGSWTNPTAHIANVADGDDARWQELIVSATTGIAATGTAISVTRLLALVATFKAAASGVTLVPRLMTLGAG